MTAIGTSPIDHRMAWRGSEIKGKDDIAFDLTARHAAALEEVLQRINKTSALSDIAPEDCRHPALDADLERVFDELQEGRGIVIVRGIPVEDMVEAGLLVAADDIPVPYDRFRDRIIFPITDGRGRVISFGTNSKANAASAVSPCTAG